VDYHSKWVEVGFTSSITSATVIEFLFSVFSREGFPEEVVSDNGKQFTSAEMEEFFKERRIVHRVTAVYNPQCNGEVERFNRVLKQQIMLAHHGKLNVARSIQNFLFLYRNTRHATTNEAPSKLLHGRVCRTKLTCRGVESVQPVDSNVLAEQVARAQRVYETGYNLRNRVREPDVVVGQKVRVKEAPGGAKLQLKYSVPKTVERVIGPSTVRIEGRAQNMRRISS
jgi:hypothetical protein